MLRAANGTTVVGSCCVRPRRVARSSSSPRRRVVRSGDGAASFSSTSERKRNKNMSLSSPPRAEEGLLRFIRAVRGQRDLLQKRKTRFIAAMRGGAKSRSGDGPTLPFKLIEQAKQHDGRVVASAKSHRPGRKALRRQAKQVKKKKAIMLAEQASRRSKKRQRVAEAEQKVERDDDVDVDEEDGDAEDDEQDEEEESFERSPAKAVPKSAYLPPHLRAAAAVAGNEDNSVLTKSVRGVLNKLAEGSLLASAQKLADLVLSSSRSAVIECVAGNVVADTTAEAASAVTQKLAAVYAAMTGLLYHDHNMGLLLPSTLAELAVARFESAYAADEAKQCGNIAMLLGYMYHFSVVGTTVVLDLARRLAASFEPLDVEVLLRLMQLAGMKLRADAPGELGEVLATVAEKAAGSSAGDSELDLRTKFMTETLASIKNNRYMAVDEHLSQINKAVKTQRGMAAPRLQQPLRCSWRDLVQGRASGQRWWLQAGAEAVLEDRVRGADGAASGESSSTSAALPADLAVLAKRLRINTDARKQAFSIVMTAEGYADAFEKLEKLKLKGKSDRDVVFVLVECCVSEATYNMYYALLAAKLCAYHKSCGLTFQFHVWDQIRDLQRFSATGRLNLALFIRDLLAQNCASLRVFQPVDFVSDMEKGVKEVVNTALSSLIADTTCSEQSLQLIFQGLSRKASDELKLLRDGLLLFVRFSLKFRKDQVNESNRGVVKRRLALAKEALQHVVSEKRSKAKGKNDDDDNDDDDDRE